MRKRQVLLLLFLMNTVSTVSLAQTHYASQSFNGIGFFNPAYVGSGGKDKFQSFYRTQFERIGSPYRTVGIGIDVNILQSRFNKDQVGMGLQAVSEQVLGGALKTNYVTLSFSDKIFLNESKSKYLSLGIGATLITTTIDASKITFGDQYYSGRLYYGSSLDRINKAPIKFSNNGGVLYTNKTENSFLQMGASLYYINSSANNQAIDHIDQTYQYITMVNFEHQIGDASTVLFYADYQKRNEDTYVYTGVSMGLPIRQYDDALNRLYIGCYYRHKDAVIPYIGLLNDTYKLGLTYDIYQKNMSLSSLKPQTLEFTLTTYLGRSNTKFFKSLFN